MAKTLYHSELTSLAWTEVTIKGDVTPSKYKGKPPFVAMIVAGEERLYNVENDTCGDALRGRNGQKLVIRAVGSRDEATIEIEGGASEPAHAAPAQPPRAAQPAPSTNTRATTATPPAQSQSVKPHGATVGMAINCACANLTERGCELDAEEVTQIASDLLRVAAWLEAGHLMPKWAEVGDNDGGAR